MSFDGSPHTDNSFNDDKANDSDKHNALANPSTDLLAEQPSNIVDQKERVMYLERELKLQEESQKSQVIHTETIGMMTKYQLVFIKLETSLNKIDLLFKSRNNANLNFSFDKLVNNRMMTVQSYHMRSKLMFFDLYGKLENATRIINKALVQNRKHAFTKIQFMMKLETHQYRFTQDQEKIKKSFLNVITQKDNEIISLTKKYQEINQGLQSQKQKELELTQKIKSMDQISQQLENDITANKRNNNQESRGSNKGLQQRVRYLESENQEMQEGIIGADDSVNSFIRDMSELLDSYEISTNS